MGRDSNARLVQILYIGRADPTYERLWEQIQHEGAGIAFATTQKAGIEQAAKLQPQLVIINTINASFSAERLCRALQRRLPSVRRLVILDRLQDEIACDQQLLRPFTPRKMRESILKLLQDSAPHTLVAGPLMLNVVTRSVNGPAGEHHLTPKQCNLLAVFMRRPNQVISRRDLMDLIWDTEYLGDTRTLDVHIRWLREKIESDPMQPQLLVTRRGIGYILAVSANNRLPAPQDEVEPLLVD